MCLIQAAQEAEFVRLCLAGNNSEHAHIGRESNPHIEGESQSWPAKIVPRRLGGRTIFIRQRVKG
jgi:hypothetical protein